MNILTLAESVLGKMHIIPLMMIVFLVTYLIRMFFYYVRTKFERKTAAIIGCVGLIAGISLLAWVLFFDGPILFEAVW